MLEGARSAEAALSPLQLKQRQFAAGRGASAVVAQQMKTVSAKLAAGSMQSAGASYGQPTALSVHPRYIAVATSRGLVLVFDHFEVLRCVLGQKEQRKLGAEAPVDPATVVDVSATLDLLLVGHESGKGT